MSSSDNNPFIGFFTGMMNQFMLDSMENGSLPAALAANTPPAASSSAPLPTLPIPPALPYTSARSQPIALPAAPAGHPLPSNNLSGYNTTQPMLGMGGLGIPVSGHSNSPRRRVDELSPTQLSETNITRRAAAREHLGPAGAALQLCIRGDRYGAGPPGPGQGVTYYKNYTSVFSQFARDSHLLFEYTVMETTKVTTLPEMSTAAM
ncbi:hypothetical protein B0H13DRAFT_2342279 [Mycena leptocephala]|nr:hypothetical protein B0H13DRAFT_2342279 [Mycena leptocephala]